MDFSIYKGKRVAQSWHSASDYEQIKAGMEDRDKLPALYADWLKGAEQREEQVRRHGGTPVRVPLELAEFKRFCAHFGIALDSEGRSKYAALKSEVSTERSSAPDGGIH